MTKYTKGDYNQTYCEIWYDDEFIGDVRPKDADTFLKLLNGLTDENNHIKNTIHDMITTERTQIGQSVLKQLMERIQ